METVKLGTGAVARFLRTSVKTDKRRHPTVLVVHGWTSNIFEKNGSYERAAHALAKEGYHSMLLSLRGHRESEGDLRHVTRSEHLNDVRLAHHFLQRHPEVNVKAICGYGASYGAYLLSSYLARSDRQLFRLLALRAPALYPDLGWAQPVERVRKFPFLQTWRESPHTREDSSALWGIGNFKGKLLLVRSEHDERQPPAVAESYAKAAKNAKLENILMKNAKHRLTERQTEKFLLILADWFKRHYPTSSH